MSKAATAARPVGLITKTARRVAVALTISIGVGLLLMHGWQSSPSALFFRTSVLGLSATTAFALFEVWPRRLPGWIQRWALQVVAVGVFMPVTTVLIYVLSTPQGAPPFWETPSRMDGWTSQAGWSSARVPPLCWRACREPDDRWADRRRCASTDSTGAESNTRSIQ